MPLSLTVDSVTPQEVDAYADARGRTVWTDAPSTPPEPKLQAIRRATDYLAATYNGRWLIEFQPNDVPDEVTFAISEAAVRELEEPGSLSEDLDPNGRIASMSAGSVSITYADGSAPADAFTGIENLLLAAGLIGRRSSTSVTFFGRA
ncbi:hypothetical protein C7441_11026 [Pseudaminobacter salicylatoxidans]|uniref:Putative DnaT-like domain-containing protein n=1 Tax=Pseudaminobacter salicylatoxidans TaxID=93369 RepID=A0A316C1T9_PSESE|nr:DnaT-like ssDNA-binding protein [Pseudaminobacter salicylatoxidans]PWJ81494.1 hypothetical protein C7441_11026 [Pseudaminobacter salicylatoxidans]